MRIIEILREIRPECDFTKIIDFTEVLDSFDIIILTTELEKEYNIKIDGSVIRKEFFKDIKSIEKLVNECK